MANEADAAILADLPFLAALSPARARLLAQQAQVRRLKRRDTLFHQGDPGDALFVIRAGLIKVYTDTVDGREKVLRLMGPGDVLGELGLFDGAARSATALAVQASVLLRFPREAVVAALLAEPEAALRLCGLMAQRVRTLTEELEDAAYLDLPGRLAKVLLDTAERVGTQHADGTLEVDLALTQQELAELVGSTRARVNEQLHSFARLGWLDVDRSVIHILKPTLLKRRYS